MSTERTSNLESEWGAFDAHSLPSSTDLDSPEGAAFCLGRALNGLRYLAEVAWLTNSLRDHGVYSRLWSQVRICAREILGTTEIHQHVQERIENTRQDWYHGFQGIYHHELLLEENELLVAAREHGRDLPNWETESDLLCRVAKQGSTTICELQSHLQGVVQDFLSRLIDLGIHVDQILHPMISSDTVSLAVVGTESNSPTAEAEHGTSVRSRPSWWLPKERPAIRPTWPNEDWHRQLTHILCWCGLGQQDVIPEPDDGSALAEFHDSILHLALTQLRQDTPSNVDVCEPTELSQESNLNRDGQFLTEVGAQAAERLGLELNSLEMSVSRSGSAHQPRLEPRLFRLLVLLLNRRGLTDEWFQEHWNLVGRNARAAPNTVLDAMADLQNRLLPLQLEIVKDSMAQRHVKEINTPSTSQSDN